MMNEKDKKFYIVTGAAGFIGANIAIKLTCGNGDIPCVIAVDDLTQGDKYRNFADCTLTGYYDKDEFLKHIISDTLPNPENIAAIFHQGACSDTMESNGKYMMENNYLYSLHLLEWAQKYNIPMLYASSAAVYGGADKFFSTPDNEKPLNIYGYSKLLFDQIVRQKIKDKSLTIPIIGFRYFNVYGPRESHKGRMASVPFHHFQQYQKQGYVNLFKGSGGYADGEQQRDFIYIDDVVRANINAYHLFAQGHKRQAIVNLGTGSAQSFNALSAGMVNACRHFKNQPELSLEQLQTQKLIRYIDFPDALKGKYQHYTQADMSCFTEEIGRYGVTNITDATRAYCRWLLDNQ
ncbi:MAG: ADP-glyceromanno-heptose 6-epimerase [Alphaproteobacteria bacterium]|nr:ADP-glyceromanno-heptose 6-epimerase [Alphaproteobacteria bacterium]